MEKYAVIYENMQCATLTGVADSRAVAWKDNSVLREYARKGLIEVARLLEVNNKLPVFVHIFSNGGGFVWEVRETTKFVFESCVF